MGECSGTGQAFEARADVSGADASRGGGSDVPSDVAGVGEGNPNRHNFEN